MNSPKKQKPVGSPTSIALQGHVGNDGSFARTHLALNMFREKAYGRPYHLSVPCMNEWATEIIPTSSKKEVQLRRRRPYTVCDIEILLIYVPPMPIGVKGNLPNSLNQCIKDMKSAEWHSQSLCEGYLSQQGGDCPVILIRFNISNTDQLVLAQTSV